jgi:hypothetical protein
MSTAISIMAVRVEEVPREYSRYKDGRNCMKGQQTFVIDCCILGLSAVWQVA